MRHSPIKLVVHDERHAAGLFLAGFCGMPQVVHELRPLRDADSASELLERFAERCLRSGRGFESADPLIDTCPSGADIVEVHLDPTLPRTPFVRLFEVDERGPALAPPPRHAGRHRRAAGAAALRPITPPRGPRSRG